MIEIIPAVMPQSFQELEQKIGSVRRRVKTVHLDVMDGTVTPSVNWPFVPGGQEEMDKLTSGEVGLPFWKDVNYEVDLMVQNPEESFAEWVNAGFHRIIVHVETTQKLLSLIKEWKGVVEIGVAIGMETNNEDVYKYIDAGADFAQFMGIFQIGFQGNPFDSRVFEKISKMRQVYPQLPISVDGGVSLETAPKLLEAGADRLVVGSAIFKKKSEFEGIDTSMLSSVYDIGKSVEISDLEPAYDRGADEAVIEFKKLASDFSEKTLLRSSYAGQA